MKLGFPKNMEFAFLKTRVLRRLIFVSSGVFVIFQEPVKNICLCVINTGSSPSHNLACQLSSSWLFDRHLHRETNSRHRRLLQNEFRLNKGRHNQYDRFDSGVVRNHQFLQKAEKRDVAGLQEKVFVRKVIGLLDKFLTYVRKRAFEIFCNMGVAGSSRAKLLATFCDDILKKGGSEKLSDEAIEDTLENVFYCYGCHPFYRRGNKV
ncbi:hypothetical protein L1987_37011 [Smallanthus sonchifolius]|uniref:Uncharacterized protein n=1 Tax=Smallanthus sonchifolius TaxID=185202 RepID=A0ACB9HGH5_9ASTR|nr:hypothetical protein L1987_37011 [Smallanthus sonchifolius]